ncbi:glycosyltransferase family 2 protein [Gynuella sp.]|uniref:glycosyltransferase family 2 protein n=1 Tax=Gynuella sp. TaxID=2969146 RepID=UPI003D13FC83
MKISVIFTTYNSPAWLEKVLWGFNCQTDQNFELLIADDGSGEETQQLISRFQQEARFEIHHIWQPDEGFQKCRILNKAIVAATGEYIVMTDGDCIPRNDFVAAHRQAAQPGCFLSGGYFKLPMETSKVITRHDIETGNCFDTEWLAKHGVKPSIKFMKLTKQPTLASLYNTVTMTKRSWNGHNASCWKQDALKVNGFDERMKYGGLDCEFGGRLLNAGIKAKQIRYKAICIHLDHSRGYVNEEDWKRNRIIRKTSIQEKLIETPAGIKQSH